jgi:cysteinyl-tRNA synthetase
MDLKFPHHENEIAQSCAATGDRFAELWVHNGFVNVDDQKMSKSLGNFFTVREVLPALRHPEVLRYFVLMSHYRGPINYSPEQLEQADAALGRLYTALRDLPAAAAVESSLTRDLHAAMDDDFNTPEALAALQTASHEVNSAKDAGDGQRAAALGAELRSLGSMLGILTLPAEQWFRLPKRLNLGSVGQREGTEGALADADVERLVAARVTARKARSWAESDRIRDELLRAGVILEDRPDGSTSWRRA